MVKVYSGDILLNKRSRTRSGYYLVANISSGFLLISLTDGNRWQDHPLPKQFDENYRPYTTLKEVQSQYGNGTWATVNKQLKLS